jgi:hypothetical protein
MTSINKYHKSLKFLINGYQENIPSNVSAINNKIPTWEDPVWYIKDIDTGLKHRYLLTKKYSEFNQRLSNSYLDIPKNYKEVVLTNCYARLLKIYTLEVQELNIASTSKKSRVRTAAEILTIAECLNSLNDIPLSKWEGVKLSNLFWDFCKNHKLLAGRRPVLADRTRSADETIDRSNINLKMVSDSAIVASGEIFQRVFRDINNEGILDDGGWINITDAITVTGILLGLASPSRLNSELPLLPNQVVKVLNVTENTQINYLHWSGSKGYQDNQTHILSALAPQVKKAINFFHHCFKPERHYIRYLKNPTLSWKELLNGFEVDLMYKSFLNFEIPPNIFTAAYALGFYPADQKISILKDKKYIIKNDTTSLWKYSKVMNSDNVAISGREQAHEFIHISQIHNEHLILNLKGNSSKYSGIHQLLQCKVITHTSDKELNIPLISTVMDLELALFKIQLTRIPTFPIGYSSTDKGIDMEHALFCYAPRKHHLKYKKGLSGCPLIITSLTTVLKDLCKGMGSDKQSPNKNIFINYGYGNLSIKPHSLRHYSNTQAEKSRIPLAVIAAWSGRVSIKQTLEYVHTSEEEKTERVISTLDLDCSKKDIRVISKEELGRYGALPASITETGICVQELSVSPCNYINNFLNGCFGCESACYVCGDQKAIEIFKYDIQFQTARLEAYKSQQNISLSSANKKWWVNHSQGVALLEQLIEVLNTSLLGNLVRISTDKKNIFITNPKTKEVQEVKLSIPPVETLLKKIDCVQTINNNVPEEMKALLFSFGIVKP